MSQEASDKQAEPRKLVRMSFFVNSKSSPVPILRHARLSSPRNILTLKICSGETFNYINRPYLQLRRTEVPFLFRFPRIHRSIPSLFDSQYPSDLLNSLNAP